MSQEETFGTGKLPADYLNSLLERFGGSDPRVLVRPGVGLDAAVLELGNQLIVAKSDPITFATDEIGWYAVHINANDVACMGGYPQWFLATLLLPPDSPATLVEEIFSQIRNACDSIGVELIGGHTEMTHGLDRPLLAGTMLGTVDRKHLVTPERAQPGDHIIVAKGFPIEGAAIIAHERAEELQARGWEAAEIEEAQGYLQDPGISVLRVARIAVEAVPLNGMHDPTEGGLVTGLREIARAANLGLKIDADALPLLPLADRLCRAFDLDPLGTIASGALLLAVSPEYSEGLLAAYEASDIPARVVGELLDTGEGEWLERETGREPLPDFDVDEITKLF